MGRPTFGCMWLLLLALFTFYANADCTSYGVDYSSGGSYYIDSASNQYFSFVNVFQGCSQETISPVLVGPDDSVYACSDISTTPAGTQITSTCGIPFSAMRSGRWKIVISGRQISSQRTITLTVGVPQTTWVTATPTVVVGYTTTARAQTILTTLVLTETLIVVPRTVTAPCNGATRTITNYQQTPTVVVISTATRTATDGQVTSFWTTTVSATATCHYPQNKRDVAATAATAAVAAVAAVTSTYTQTTYTVTSTSVTTVPARTTTELVVRTTTATVTPSPSTVCAGGNPGVTITVTRGNPVPVTQTDVVYLTTHLSGTVWVGQTQFTTVTNSASATACWRAGGWIG
ncbi:hypothetical protein C8A05DRAFT_40471 [Staphylotrichum tortipilum]|uniref:Uncharacterized protein n=1 Tax=Staphylotrichum tortipilum TaxID=2831512 RepID=A0AAN6MUH5_9PEZI|nr:hypothetical protein C8A05DRAFT_40471 [Staphylotrichum longicolle]